MKTISKNFIALLVFSWIFSSWPGIKQAQAATKTFYFRSTASTVVSGNASVDQLSETAGTTDDIGTTIKHAKDAGTWQFIPGTANNTTTYVIPSTPNSKGWIWDESSPGDFASSQWTINVDVVDNATTGTAIIKAQVWKVTATTTTVTQVTNLSGILSSASFNPSTSQTRITLTFTPTAFSLAAGEYIYVEVYLTMAVKAGSANATMTKVLDSANVDIQGKIVTSDFTPIVTLSISVSPLTWGVGTVDVGTVQVSTSGNKIGVTNNGNVSETFTLQIYDEDDRNEWTHSSLKTGAGNNIYVLSGIFCATADSPIETSFNATDSEDVLTTTQQTATATKFAYAGGSANAVAVSISGQRSLWLRLDMPTAVSGTYAYEQHTVTVRISCQQS